MKKDDRASLGSCCSQLGDLDQMANSGGTCSTAAVPIVRPSQMSVGVTTFGVEVLQLLASRIVMLNFGVGRAIEWCDGS